MKKLLLNTCLAVLVTSMSSPVMAQMGGAGSDPASKAMEKLMGVLKKSSFSAKAVMNISGKQKLPEMSFDFMVSNGRTRMELDMGAMMGAAGEKSGMPAMGKMVTVTIPDAKKIYQIMPAMKAYCEIAIPEGAAGKAESAKIDRKVEGTETIDGHKCEKVRSTVTAPDGKTAEILTWEAKDLGGIPIKTEIQSPEGTITMTFKNIKTDKLPDSLFQAPSGFTKHNSMQELMMSSMMQMMQQPGQ